MKSLYLIVNICTIIVPFLFSFHPRLQFYKTFKAFFTANAIVALLFIIWDIYFTGLGVWGFNPKYTLGLSIINLPLEEILFFICIPFACVFTYYCIIQFYTIRWNAQFEKWFVIMFSSVLCILGLFFITKAYTAYTFISLSLLLVFLKFYLRVSWLPEICSIYLPLLIPFFIVNGILTGTGLDEPIVWYNNAENLGLRLLTIPVEDVFYGFELILLNTALYNFFRIRFKK